MFMSRTTLLALKRLPTTLSTRSDILAPCYNPHSTQRRRYASSNIFPDAPPEGASVAVLGGGITGLVSAYELTQRRPDLHITLFEGSNRLGGWLHSTSVDVGTGRVVFEQGPRNLRPSWPNGYITLDLIDRLGLSDRLLMTSKSSPAAQNRFIYYPDHLVRMPGPGLSIWGNLKNMAAEPLLEKLPEVLLKELWKPKRSPELQDESVGSFISRRFGSDVADNIVSAIFHGIYAGDIYKLSARSIIPSAWFFEALKGSVVNGAIFAMAKGMQPVWRSRTDQELIMSMGERSPSEDALAARESSVFTFKGGVGELANRLEKRLRANRNVEIRTQCKMEEIALQGHGKYARTKVITQDLSSRKKTKGSRDYSHVISTLPANNLASIVSKSTPLPSLSSLRAVTVMVVNLFYRNPSLLSTKGFGYLLPRSLPVDQNPERALGVIFDSDAAIGQDAVEGTKLTVMLGGHWWDDFDTYPDEDLGVLMAKRVLKRHLKITESPQAVRVSLQKNCIPQYEIGHDQRMARADRELKPFEGRLRVAGSSYTGVGLNDCVKAAAACALELTLGRHGTGLGSFAGDQAMIWESKAMTIASLKKASWT